MSAIAPEADAPTVSLCLPGSELALGDVLRTFETLRRSLATTCTGSEGAFAGFDRLDVSSWSGEAEEGHVVFEAQLVAEDGRSHVADYTASRCDHRDGECERRATDERFIEGRGRTVGLRAAVGSRSGAYFAIAAPHR
jgi:hypothetical protein